MPSAQNLLQKIEALPPERQGEVEDFVDFLSAKSERAAEGWDHKTGREGTLGEFFAASPLAGSGITIERVHDEPRKLDL